MAYFVRYLTKEDKLLDNLFRMNTDNAKPEEYSKLISDSIYMIRCVFNHQGFRVKYSSIVY